MQRGPMKRVRRRCRAAAPIAFAMLLLASERCCLADEERTYYEEPVPRPHTTGESVKYLASLYFITLGGYLYISRNEVFNNATLQSYGRNFGSITIFDQDLPSSNWGVHLITGAVAYEFYRARSYAKEDAFFMTLAQECLFQFTVETLLFPTGMENIMNTAVIGTIIGRGLEVASLPMLNSDFFLSRFFGHVLNLPTALGLYENTKVLPIIERKSAGLMVQVGF